MPLVSYNDTTLHKQRLKVVKRGNHKKTISLGDTNFVVGNSNHKQVYNNLKFQKTQSQTGQRFFSDQNNQVKLVNRQGIPILTIRDKADQDKKQGSKFQNEVLKKLEFNQNGEKGSAKQKKQKFTQKDFYSTQTNGFLSQRLSPLRLKDKELLFSKDSTRGRESQTRDISYLKEKPLKNDQSQFDQQSQSQKNIFIVERDLDQTLSGGYPFYRDFTSLSKQRRQQALQANSQFNQTQSSFYEASQTQIRKSSLMFFPKFINSYQNYKITKKEVKLDQIEQSKTVSFDKLKSNFQEFTEKQTHCSNNPVTFPQSQGMMQAFGLPSSRQQVELLITWFDQAIQTLIPQTINQHELKDSVILVSQDNDFEKEFKSQSVREGLLQKASASLEDLLEFTQRELISQVSIQCQERGFLLEKVISMRLGLYQDTVEQLAKDKRKLNLKALSRIMQLKEQHQAEIKEGEEKIEEQRMQHAQGLEEKQALLKKQEDLEMQIEDLKYKKKQLMKMNNHLIDSLVIKANQIKLANKKFKFKVFNQIDEKDEHFLQGNLRSQPQRQQTENILLSAQGLQKKIMNSRRSSRLFKHTENQEVKKVQEDLRNHIAKRVRKLLDRSAQTDSNTDEQDQSKYHLEGFNPKGNLNDGLQYLEQNVRNIEKAQEQDVEVSNIQKILEVKVKLENLHDKSEKTSPVSTANKQGPQSLLGQSKFDSIDQHQNFNSQKSDLTMKNQHVMSLALVEDKNSLNFSQIQALNKNDLSNIIVNSNDDEEEEEELLSSENNNSSVSYDDKSMQFPEDDMLNESDFLEQRPEVKAETPKVLVIRDQFSPLPSPELKNKNQQHKFVKKQKEEESVNNEPKQKKLIIDLNLKQLKMPGDGQKQSPHSNNHSVSQVDDEKEALLLLEDDEELNQDIIKEEAEEDGTNLNQDLQETLEQNQARQEEMRQFLEQPAGNNNQDEVIMCEIEPVGLGSADKSIELYEEINEKNSIFYQQQQTQQQPGDQVQNETQTKNKEAFINKVDTIVGTILENIQTNKMPKKKLLQLVVSNVLRNEQDEIKQLVIDQFFGGADDPASPLRKFTKSLSSSDSPYNTNKLQSQDLRNIQGLNLPSYLMLNTRDQGIQTDTLWMIDFLECGVFPAEMYKFDRKAKRMLKFTYHRDQDLEVIKQQEFVFREDPGQLVQDRKGLKQSANDPNSKAFQALAVSAKLELERTNQILQELQSKIRELEEQVSLLEDKKEQVEEHLEMKARGLTGFKDRWVEQFDLWINSWRRGFTIGFERGMSSGYFKGALENKDLGIQEGFQMGIKDGWGFGFDDGFKIGIRKIYQEAKEKGIDVTLLTQALHLYLSQSEKRQGIQQQIVQRLFKVSPSVNIKTITKIYLDKFNNYNEKKKKNYAKLGLKSVIKMIRQYFALKVAAKDMLLSEFIFEECQKKFGHNKMSKKAFIQFLASSYYHMNMHAKINIFCSFLHINNKPYSNEVLNFYVSIIEALGNSNIGLKNEYDEKTDRESVALTKTVEVMRDHLEKMLPTEIILELRDRIEKLKIKGSKNSQPYIDMDKYLDFMLKSFIKFHVDLINKPQLIYFAWTLYEKNHLSYNELFVTLEIVSGDQSLKMVNELREHIRMQKKELLKLFEEGCLVEGEVLVRFTQFHEIIKDSDLLHTKKAREIFSQLPFRSSVQKFKEIFEEKALGLKAQIKEIYSNQEIIDKMDNIDKKEYWYDRIYAIERNIGEVNSTLLYLSLLFVSESLIFLQQYKNDTIKALWEEKNGKKAPVGVDLQELMNSQTTSQFQETKIKQQIKSKVEEITKNAQPTFSRKQRQSVLSISPKKKSNQIT